MPDYRDGGTSETPPWYPHVNRISSLTIGEGVTRIGDYAFMLCSFVTKVVIPESVTSMGDWAFWHCQSLNMQLNKDGYAIVFCDTKSDCFRYAILPISEFVQFENTELGDYLTIISPKIYNIYLVDKGNEFPKIMLYLKKKFSVPLSEIKEFCSKDKILLGIGNSIIVDEYRKEIEKLGGKIEVEENRPITNSKPTE